MITATTNGTPEARSAPAEDKDDLPAKFVVALRSPWARLAVVLVWLALGIGGLSVVKLFMAGLQSAADPVRGTASYEAQEVFDNYFPAEPLTGAMLMESADGSPLLNFVERSTCEPKNTAELLPGHSARLILRCENASALGGGCLTSADLNSIVMKTAKTVLANASATTRSAALFYLNSELSKLPQVKSCPEVSNGKLTQELLDFTDSLKDNMNSRLSDFTSTVVSFSSLPATTVVQTINLTNMSIPVKVPGNLSTIQVNLTIPAGEFWYLLKDQLMADDYRTSLIAVSTSSKTGDQVKPMSPDARVVSNVVKDLASTAPYPLRGKESSMNSMFVSVQAGIDKTMSMSSKTLPFALLILAAMAQNLRLVVVTVINLLACLTSAILFMYPISTVMMTATMAPALMVSIALAMSIDYSLFILTRFQTEVTQGRSAETAVAIALRTSGRIVMVSGLTLCLCFLMMLCLPVAIISSMGVSASITTFMAVMAALTISPVVLLQCSAFFTSNKHWGLSLEGCCCRRRLAPVDMSAVPSGSARGTLGRLFAPRSDELLQRHAAEYCDEVTHSRWGQFGVWIQKFDWVVAVALVVVAVPVAATTIPRLNHSVGLLPMMPSDADATHTLLELQKSFGAGAVFPTTLLVIPNKGLTANDAALADWLPKSCEALKTIADKLNIEDDKVPPFRASSFQGVMMLDGTCLPASMGSAMGSLGGWSHVGGNYSATQVRISYAIDPFSTAGLDWLSRLQKAVDAPEVRAIASWYIFGQAPVQMDVSNATFARLPFMILLMMGIVLVVMAVAFKSVVASFRAVFCLSWMLIVTFGISVYVFQDGILNFLHYDQLGARPTGAMTWMSPCMSFSVLVGLGLDYDIFYSERVVEEWEHGYDEKESAVRALSATANTITAAGVIMVIAFGALLLSETAALNEISFLLSIGVIIDCFITTKVILPCVMALLGRRNLNFWPRKRLTKPAHEVGLETSLHTMRRA
jgi:predicted RND superfamily exporter protein